MVNIFVSGKYNDMFYISNRINELKKLGYNVTHDWTKHKDDTFINKAVNDINGVKNCDVHVVIITDDSYAYRGTFTEIGCSLGLDKKIIIVCPYDKPLCSNVPFFHHPNINHCKSWTECLLILERFNSDFTSK